jgi:hypothetical protein
VSALAPVRPPQEILDGLSLDAAWERAQDLEEEVHRLRAMLKVNSQHFEAAVTAYHKMERGIWEIIGKHQVPDGELLADLEALVTKVE